MHPETPTLLSYAGESLAEISMELTAVLQLEIRLVRELLRVVRLQREAVLADDLHTVEATIYDTHRVLHTLNEAKRRRRPINRRLGLGGEVPFRDFGPALRERMSLAVHETAAELEQLARVLADEIELNRTKLREALAG